MINLEKKHHTFVKRDFLGKCEICNEQVFSDQLHVLEDDVVCHFVCYNRRVREKIDKNE